MIKLGNGIKLSGGAKLSKSYASEDLEPPVATAATELGTKRFTANWNAVDGATHYRIDVSDDVFLTYLVGWESKELDSLSVIVSNLINSTLYYYRVRAVKYL